MAFRPTHVVPQGGMQAWSEPDPSHEPGVELAAGTEVAVVEQRGQWARVEAVNGWSGWLDSGRLVPRPPGPPGAGATGALGQPRGIAVSVLLAIVTVGIYTFVWVYKTHKEIKEHSGIGIGGALGVVIYIVLSAATFFLVPSEIRQLYEQDGRVSPVTGWWGLWFLLPLIGPLVWFIRVQGALNDYWVSKGAPAP